MSLFLLPRTASYGFNVKPAAGALLYFYEAGTTTAKTVYSDYAESVALTQPVTADASGRFVAIYVSGTYKVVLKDADGNTIFTEDNLVGRDGDLQDKGTFTSSTNSSNYPSSGSLGDWYRVAETFTLAAASGSHNLFDGDFIVANKNGATAIDADWEIVLGVNSRPLAADFSTKNLQIDVASNTTVSLSADAIVLTNSNGETKRISDISDTYDITADLQTGTSEKASHWYQLWIDSDETLKMVPDLSSTADADVANKLSDSAADFIADLVQVGDEIYRTTDNTKGYVGAVDSTGVISCVDGDGAALDLFPDGNETYIIRGLSPVGLGAFRARLGAAYNNSSSNLDDSFYTQIQEPKYYSEAAGDFTVTGAGWTTAFAEIIIEQIMDWTNISKWVLSANIRGDLSAAGRTGITITISGVTFTKLQNLDAFAYTGNPAILRKYTDVSSGDIVILHASTTTSDYYINANRVDISKKPTFHT